MGLRSFSVIFLYWYCLHLIPCTDAQCTFPSALRGEWLFSKQANVTFNSTHLDGYLPCGTQNCPPVLPDSLECWDNLGSAYVLRTENFTDSGVTGRLYLCLYLIQLTSVKFLAYQGPNARHAIYDDYVKPSRSTAPPLYVSDVCNLQTNPFPASRHYLFIKADSVDSAASTCPTEMLGNFQTTGLCNTTIDVCNDKTQVVVDNSTCSSNVFYTEAGSLSCLHGVAKGGTTYLTLYNRDLVVNDNTTFSFTCLAIVENGGQVLITQSPRVCDGLTTPSTASADLTLAPNILCPFTCTFPTSLIGKWLSNRKGELVISRGSMSGFEPYGEGCTSCTSQPTDYECYMQSGSKYLIRSPRTDIAGDSVRIYVCLDVSQVSDTKYTYYQAHSTTHTELGDHLITLNAAAPVDAFTDVCETSVGYDPALYSVLVKSSDVSQSLISCPDDLHQIYNTTNVLCDYTLSTCEDEQNIKLSDASCNPSPFYTAGGTVSCVYSISGNGVTYLTLYNQDVTVDDSATFQFSCIAFKKSGTALRFTQTPQGCHAGQNSTSVSTANGLAFEFQFIESCPEDQFNWIIIVAVICGIIGLIIVALIIWYLCCGRQWCRRRREQKEKDQENILDKDDDNKTNGQKRKDVEGGEVVTRVEGGEVVTRVEGGEVVTRVEGGEKDKKSKSGLVGFLDIFTIGREKEATVRENKKSKLKHRRRGKKDGKDISDSDSQDEDAEKGGKGEKRNKKRRGRRRKRRRKRKMKIVSRTLPDGTVIEEEVSTDATTDEEGDGDRSSDDDYSYSDDFTSDDYSSYDSDDPRVGEKRKGTLFGSRYNLHVAMAWAHRKNNPQLVQDEAQPRTRQEHELEEDKNLSQGMSPGKDSGVKTMAGRAAWQKKNGVATDKNQTPQSNPRDKQSAGFFPWSKHRTGQDKMHNMRPANFQNTPFMAQYGQYTNQRSKLDDEGFWDDQDGHFKSSEEQFGFGDLDVQFEEKGDETLQKTEAVSLQEEAEAAGDKGRQRSERRVIISGKPPESAVSPTSEGEDTGVENQDTSRESTQADIAPSSSKITECEESFSSLSKTRRQSLLTQNIRLPYCL